MFTRIAFFVVVATGLGLAAPAMADYQVILDYNSGLCMGVQAGLMQANQPIIQWTCNAGPDQTWLVPAPGANNVQIQNSKNSSYCLAVNDYNEGSQLVIQPCFENGSAPRGTFWSVSGPVSGETYNGMVLTSDMSSFVAAVSGAGTSPGNPIIQWADQITGPNTHLEQQWNFEPTSVTFNLYAWTSIENDGSGSALTGNLNVSINGNWSVSGGEFTAYDHSGDSVNFTATCSEANLQYWPSWSDSIGGNVLQDPTCKLTGSGNNSYLTADWRAIVSGWQSSGGQASCFLSAWAG
jgi:hypothetical protein